MIFELNSIFFVLPNSSFQEPESKLEKSRKPKWTRIGLSLNEAMKGMFWMAHPNGIMQIRSVQLFKPIL